MVNEKQFLEDLMWTSYRYCIGRHTYTTSLAKDIGEYFYDKLTNERKQFTAYDIRSSIAQCLQCQSFNFHISYQYDVTKIKPLEMFFEFVNSQENRNEEGWLSKIKSVEVYKDKEEINYEVSYRTNPRFNTPIYEHDILDLLPWMDLASLFDVESHKIVVCEDNGHTKEIECYESYVNVTETDDRADSVMGKTYHYVKPLPWNYKKVYRPVDYYVSNRYIEPSCIKEVKEM